MNVYRVRLRRSVLYRVFSGLCGGIGEVLGLSGWWVRGAFVALLLTAAPLALFLYLLLWVAIPPQRLSDLPPLIRPGEPDVPRYARPEGILTVGGLCVLSGVFLLAETTGVLRATGGEDLLPPIMAILIALLILLKQLRGTP